MPKKKESALHKKLAERLVSMIPDLDEPGLAFLIEQAQIHLYNMEVERDEAAYEAEAKKEGATGPKKKAAKTATAAADHGPAQYRIERSSSGSSYHIISAGKWKMYTDDEMLAMVQIAQSNDPKAEVTERLWRWLETERPDTFPDLEIDGLHDPRMKELMEFLRAKFAVKQK